MKPPAFFIGDDPAMDFLNTIASPQGLTIEFIGDGRTYVRWLVSAKLLQEADARRALATFSAKQLDEIAGEARSIREWFRERLGVARINSSALTSRSTKEWLNRLNALLVTQSGYKCLEVDADGWNLVEHQRYDQVEQLLVPVVEAISWIFVEPNPALIKRCANPSCTLMFRDRTKAHSRAYCSPAMCGNRAKVAAFRARQKRIIRVESEA